VRSTDTAAGHTRGLVLLRHGRTTGYEEDTFSGWPDVPLSEQGKREAVRAGELLARHGLAPDVVHTSLLSRAVATAELVLTAIDRPAVPVRRSWRLNERHYGALQGRSRSAVRAEVGDKLFDLWRHSYEHAPPSAVLTAAGGHDRPGPGGDPSRPCTESLADVRRRLEPYWRTAIARDLRAGHVTLVVGTATPCARSACTWTTSPHRR
jgi:2,3-bisphosphoglycerate-dependent phosphoglycerate mutase